MNASCPVDEAPAVQRATPRPTALPQAGGPRAVPSPHGAPELSGFGGDTARDSEVDHELLRRVAGGDREAFRHLYARYQPRLSRFLLRILRRHEDTQDVANDVMLIVWQQAGTFRGASQVSTWIFGIGYRRALKCIRGAAARARLALSEAESHPLVTEDSSRQTEDRQILNLGLARLPPDQQIVLVLAYEMDCSCDEIAAIVDCPVNTVKTRMFHARRKLRDFISVAGAPGRAGAIDAAASPGGTTPGCAMTATRDIAGPARD